MSDKLAEMWQALEAHKPDASYADAWETMCRERTKSAASWACICAAAAWANAPARAARAAWTLGAALVWDDAQAQQAIDEIKADKP